MIIQNINLKSKISQQIFQNDIKQEKTPQFQKSNNSLHQVHKL